MDNDKHPQTYAFVEQKPGVAHKLTQKSTTWEAQEKSGLNAGDWRTFYEITLKEASKLLEEDFNITFLGLPQEEQYLLFDRVNQQLVKENIKELEFELIEWRMTNVIYYTRVYRKRTRARSTGGNSAGDLPNINEEKLADLTHDPANKVEISPTAKQFYDPIRDQYEGT